MDSSPLTTLSMQMLVDRIQRGDPAAQEELCMRIGGRLERLASRMLRTFPGVKRWEQTDDVLQNSIIRLLTALKAIRPDNTRAFFGLATEQLRRQLLDLNRHYQGVFGHGRHMRDIATNADGDKVVVDLDPADSAYSSEQTRELERWQALHEAVETLPDQEREVFCLVFYHSWTQRQIGEVLGVNERTVRRYWQAACLLLSERLSGEIPS